MWINSSNTSLQSLKDGDVCWVYSRDTKSASAAVYRPALSSKWRCHGQEHFGVPSVSKFIVLPKK